MNQYLGSVLATVKAKNRGEDEFLQAVQEVLESLSPVLDKHPEYVEAKIVDCIVEQERMIDREFALEDALGFALIFRPEAGIATGINDFDGFLGTIEPLTNVLL